MELKVINDKGESLAPVAASEALFGRSYNEALVHQIVVAYHANGRSGTRAQKDRGNVKHTTKKPWRQKGTGRARAGMSSSPLWRGGGKILAVVEGLTVEQPKTKLLAQKLKAMGLAEVLIITDTVDENLFLSSRNLPNVLVLEAREVDPVSLVRFNNVLLTKAAVGQFEEMLG